MSRGDEQTNSGADGGAAGAGGGDEGIGARLAAIRGRVNEAARRAYRDGAEVTLVAVSKTYPAEAVAAAMAAGQRVFGESRMQEALAKIEALAAIQGAAATEAMAAQTAQTEFHLIGHLQRNKVNAAVGRFALIHSVDSARLIEALERRAAELGVTQRVLLQINVSGEASKEGAAPEELEGLIEALARAPHLRAEGLMTIPPYDDDPEAARPHFRRLRALLGEAAALWARHGLEAAAPAPRALSMGMSGDFEVAIEEGATIVRVGTAIFGERAG